METEPPISEVGLHGLTVKEYCAFFDLLTKRVSTDLARAMLADDAVLRAMLEAGTATLRLNGGVEAPERKITIARIRTLFCRPREQLEAVRRLNSMGYWGNWSFSARHFERAAQEMPVWTPMARLVAPVLVPRFAPPGKLLTPLWGAIRTHHTVSSRLKGWSDPLGAYSTDPDPDAFEPYLSWEWIDFEAGRGSDILRESNPELPGTLCDASLLAAAIIHPNWLRAMDAECVPFVYLGAYRVTEEKMAHELVPALVYHHLQGSPSEPKGPYLGAFSGNAAGDSRWAFPRRLPGPP